MSMHTHPDETMVYACPVCDKAPVYRRIWRANAENPDDEYRCIDTSCGETFDVPLERDSHSGGGGGRGVAKPRSEIAKLLDNADPDDIEIGGAR